MCSRLFRSSRWITAACLAFLITLVCLSWSDSYSAFTTSRYRPDEPLDGLRLETLASPPLAEDAGGERRLRIFMPSDSPHINLCKAVMSAVALGYPMPTLLNWRGDFNHPEWHLAGSHIAKLESLLAVIEDMLDNPGNYDHDVHENDLAVMIDAYDIWFQLPPSVLVERYHQLNREADQRIQRQWKDASGSDGFPIVPPKQAIVVTTAKDCQPDSESGSSPHYEHWPQSPMRNDLYGEQTDKVLPLMFDPARKWRRIRPRCINTGMIMGTMGAMRAALTRAKEKVDQATLEGRQLWSDQGLFAEVMGDQELWREWMMGVCSSWNGTASHSGLSGLDRDVRRIAETALDGKRFEFGIGLDYNFTTIPATCSAEEDAYFVKLGDRQTLEEESRKAGVPGAVRVQGPPPELVAKQFSKDDPLHDVAWDDVPLYTDFYFGNIPVGIHHNAYIDGLKPYRLKHWWNHMWFYPRLRELLTANLRTDESKPLPLGRVKLSTEGVNEDTVYWAPKADRKYKRVTVFEPEAGRGQAAFSKLDWDEVCQKGSEPWHETLFGDGKGPLEVQ